MDDWNYVFGYLMERVMPMMAYVALLTIAGKIVEVEREKVKQAVGHEPTQENMQYYYELRQEEKTRQNTRQRESDRKNIRRLVFGDEEDNNPKAN